MGVIVKFRLERDVLADAVAWAARTLPSRPSMPMLAGLLVEAGPAGLTLSSFDYEVSGRVAVAADVDEPGTVLVSGRLLADSGITRARQRGVCKVCLRFMPRRNRARRWRSRNVR